MSVVDTFNPFSVQRNLEYGGLIYELNGHYYATPSAPAESFKTITLSNALVYVPDGGEVVGFWHTHGAFSFGGLEINDIVSTPNLIDLGKMTFDWNEHFSSYDNRYMNGENDMGISVERSYVGTPGGKIILGTPIPGLDNVSNETQIGDTYGYHWKSPY